MHILLYIFLIIFSPIFSDIIDITPYEYPSPIETESEYNIVIMGTNDIHGSYFPSEINLTSSNITYKSGGLQYMGKYINLLREQWGDRFIWLDAGDQFQGAMENTLSNGSIIKVNRNNIYRQRSIILSRRIIIKSPLRLESSNILF